MLEEIKGENMQEKSMETIATENFKKWNDLLQTRKPEEVAKLYTVDCTFLPTLSEEFKKGRLGVEEYFKHFLKKNPEGSVVAGHVKALGDNCYSHDGMYDFEVDSDDDSDDRQIVEARFTFIWEKDDQGEWEITHHHSSLKPSQS